MSERTRTCSSVLGRELTRRRAVERLEDAEAALAVARLLQGRANLLAESEALADLAFLCGTRFEQADGSIEGAALAERCRHRQGDHLSFPALTGREQVPREVLAIPHVRPRGLRVTEPLEVRGQAGVKRPGPSRRDGPHVVARGLRVDQLVPPLSSAPASPASARGGSR